MRHFRGNGGTAGLAKWIEPAHPGGRLAPAMPAGSAGVDLAANFC